MTSPIPNFVQNMEDASADANFNTLKKLLEMATMNNNPSNNPNNNSNNISETNYRSIKWIIENGGLLGSVSNNPAGITDLNDAPIGWSYFQDGVTLANRPSSNDSACFVQTIEAECQHGLQVYFDGLKMYFRRFNIVLQTRNRSSFDDWILINPDLSPVNRDMLITETGLVQIEGTPRLITIQASGGGGGGSSNAAIKANAGGDTIVKSGSDTGTILITARGGGPSLNDQTHLAEYNPSTAPAGGFVVDRGGARGGEGNAVFDGSRLYVRSGSNGGQSDLVVLDITQNIPSALHFTIGGGGRGGSHGHNPPIAFYESGQKGYARLIINY